jgi:hypothetical protein
MRTRGAKQGCSSRGPGRWGRAWLALCLFCLWSESAGLFTGCSSSGPADTARPSASSGNRTICWVFFDFDSLFCSPCLAPLLEFCRSLPVSIQEDRVRGILVYGARPDRESDGQYARIVQKKLRGFAKANSLQFPIVLDGLHVFNNLAKSSVRALLFDDNHQAMKAYGFPLKPGERGEIMQLLLDSDQRNN